MTDPAINATLDTPQSDVALLGLPLDTVTHEELAERVFVDLNQGRGGYIMTPNLDNLRGVSRDPSLRALALSADVRVADGMPLLWASRIRGTPLRSRVPGSDLIWTLSEAAAKRGRSIFLLGGSPGTAERAATVLTSRFPALRLAGTYCPPFGYDADDSAITRICEELRLTEPDVVLIGLPFPKASALVDTIRDQLGATWFVGLGISFSFVCGDVTRAPRWMQRAGLEWLHRLFQEPQRLFRRYIIEGLPFVGTLFLSAAVDRRHLSSRRA